MAENIIFSDLAGFQPKQLKAWHTILSPECKYLLYGGGAGGGKSYLLRWTAVGLAMYYYAKYGIRGIPIGLFSEDYPTLRDRQLTKIQREFPEWLGVLKETAVDGLCFFLTDKYGGGKIMLRNLDDPSKYASVEFAAILVEELTKNKYQTFEDLRTRMRFPGVTERKFVAATNPGEIGHGWVKHLWVTPDENDPDLEQSRFFFIQSLVSDNKYNPEDYAIQLQAIRDPQKRKALLEGDWNQFAGQYFDEWRDRLHICLPFMPSGKSVIVGGLDWGRTAPFSFHLTEITKQNYQGINFYRSKVFLEVYGTDKDASDWATIIVNKLKGFGLTLRDVAWVRADTQIFAKGQDSRAIDIYNQFVQANDDFRMLKPANKDRIGGWANLHKWLSLAPDGLPYLQFSSECVNAIRTLPDLVHDELKVEDVDSDGDDHAADDLRYLHFGLKWIDARVGAVNARPLVSDRINRTARFIDDKQVGMDLDNFTTPKGTPITPGRVGAVIHP